MSTYAERVRFARDLRHLTQVRLARESGVSRQLVTRIESGATVKPHADTVLRLASALRVNESWLMGMARPMARDLWFVYWMTDAYNAVIYVGMTGDLIRRREQHRYDPWAREVHAYAYQVHPSYDQAIKAEREAIGVLAPRHNVRHAPQLLERTKLVR